jgi:cytochrome c oxidase cbb3-type subunit 3
MGESIYLVQCSQCHGNTGDGLSGKAADLQKWGKKEGVLLTIENGSKGLGYPMGEMPGGMAQGADAEEIAAYVAGGMKGEQPASFAACASCHGEDGKGMDGQSPDLTTYGQVEFVSHVLQNGKKGMIGHMPAFKSMITPVQAKALTAYIQSLGN